MIDGLARNVLQKLSDQYDINRAIKLQNVPDSIKYEEPLQPPTIANGLISLDPTDYLLGAPLSRLGRVNKLTQLATPMSRQAGEIDPEIAAWMAAGAAAPAIGYGLGRFYSSKY